LICHSFDTRRREGVTDGGPRVGRAGDCEQGLPICLDIQSRDLVESDRFGRYVRGYAINGAALLLEGAGHWLTDERPDELSAAPLFWLRVGVELDLGQVFAEFGPEEHVQLYGRGIRGRLVPMLGETGGASSWPTVCS
jgi:hypothetical protein